MSRSRLAVHGKRKANSLTREIKPNCRYWEVYFGILCRKPWFLPPQQHGQLACVFTCLCLSAPTLSVWLLLATLSPQITRFSFNSILIPSVSVLTCIFWFIFGFYFIPILCRSIFSLFCPSIFSPLWLLLRLEIPFLSEKFSVTPPFVCFQLGIRWCLDSRIATKCPSCKARSPGKVWENFFFLREPMQWLVFIRKKKLMHILSKLVQGLSGN